MEPLTAKNQFFFRAYILPSCWYALSVLLFWFCTRHACRCQAKLPTWYYL